MNAVLDSMIRATHPVQCSLHDFVTLITSSDVITRYYTTVNVFIPYYDHLFGPNILLPISN